MTQTQMVKDGYFIWLTEMVCKRYTDVISFSRLLDHLHGIEFTYIHPMDRNRACDGQDLRYRFALEQGYEDTSTWILHILDGPCSVLEMLVGLALRCEEQIMDDPEMGDRTSQWFWNMIVNLGLGPMSDDRYDPEFVEEVIYRFLSRDYDPDGKGGLFHIRDCKHDLRNIEIWRQLCWYLDRI